jgi:hypothetical protein
VNVIQDTQKELMLELIHPVFGEQNEKTEVADVDDIPKIATPKKRQKGKASAKKTGSSKKRKKSN